MKKILCLCLITMLWPALAAGGFIDNGNGTVTDTGTGLMWQQATAPGAYTWQQALAYCENLTLAGYSDWRLPNRNELQSLVDYGRYNPAINTDYFPDTLSGDFWSGYWSSTTYASNPDVAWLVYFYYGYMNGYGKSDFGYVRAVRGGQSGGFGDLGVSFLEKSGSSYRTVTGAAADGAAEGVIRVSGLNQSDVVEISLPSDGSDGVMQNDGTRSMADNNTWIYKQTYRAPDKFVKSVGDETIGKREIDLKVRLSGVELSHSPFYLHKPPVVLVPGIWYAPDTWKKMSETLKHDYGFEYVTKLDYEDSKAAHFASNSSVVNDGLDDILKSARNKKNNNIAVRKVDVVAHSMGGMLTKLYGDASKIRSITTVGTPHYGSPGANFLWSLVDDFHSPFENAIAGFFDKADHPLRDGAIEDLRAGGDGLHCEWNEIASADNHVIAGISPLTNQEVIFVIKLLANVCKLYGILPVAATLLDLNQMLFNNERNDWIVSESSQEGGSSTGYDDYVWWHGSETGDAEIMQKIETILRDPTVFTISESLSMPKTMQQSYAALPQINIPLMNSVPGTVAIVNPAQGQVFQPGAMVSVTVNVSSSQAMVLISTLTGESTLLEQAPYVWEFTVPQDAMGNLIITAAATDNTGFIGSDEVTINIATTASLTALELYPDVDPLSLDMGSQKQLTVYGMYNNSAEKNITLAEGTTYQSSNPGVATVAGNGLITCTGGGETTITVTNSGITQTKQVVVTVAEQTVVTLSKFTATGKNGRVVIQWSSESEIDNAGFNIYRAEAKDGRFEKINNALIPAKGSSTQGASYEYVDKEVKNGRTYYYKLEDIDLAGKSTYHGPVSAKPRLIFGFRG